MSMGFDRRSQRRRPWSNQSGIITLLKATILLSSVTVPSVVNAEAPAGVTVTRATLETLVKSRVLAKAKLEPVWAGLLEHGSAAINTHSQGLSLHSHHHPADELDRSQTSPKGGVKEKRKESDGGGGGGGGSAAPGADANFVNWNVAEWPALTINSAADVLDGVVAVLTTPVTLHITMATGWMLLLGLIVLLGSTKRGFAKASMLLIGSIILHHIANVVLMSRDGNGLLEGGSALGWVQALVGVPMYVAPLFTTVKAAWSIMHSFGLVRGSEISSMVRHVRSNHHHHRHHHYHHPRVHRACLVLEAVLFSVSIVMYRGSKHKFSQAKLLLVPIFGSAYLAVASLVFLLTGVPHTLTGDGSAVSKPLPLASAVFAAVLLRVGGGAASGLGGLDALLSQFGLHAVLATTNARMDEIGRVVESKLSEIGGVMRIKLSELGDLAGSKLAEAAAALSHKWEALLAGGGARGAPSRLVYLFVQDQVAWAAQTANWCAARLLYVWSATTAHTHTDLELNITAREPLRSTVNDARQSRSSERGGGKAKGGARAAGGKETAMPGRGRGDLRALETPALRAKLGTALSTLSTTTGTAVDTLKAAHARMDQQLGDLSTTLDPHVRHGCVVTAWVVIVLGGAMVGRMASGRPKRRAAMERKRPKKESNSGPPSSSPLKALREAFNSTLVDDGQSDSDSEVEEDKSTEMVGPKEDKTKDMGRLKFVTFHSQTLGMRFTIKKELTTGDLHAVITEVTAGGAADKLGVHVNDRMISINNVPIAFEDNSIALEDKSIDALAARPLTLCLERDANEDGRDTPNVYRAKKYAAAPIPKELPSSGEGGSTGPDVKGQISQLNWIRRLVSKKKRRLQQDGFDLDLTYITPNLLAMGFPSSGVKGMYRNPASEVKKFLQSKHGEHYWVTNLCSERSYSPSLFDERVSRHPFDDHQPPRLQQMGQFCAEAAAWLEADPRNVLAVHCKAGKGRTGVMLCAYLLWANECHTADDALAFYGIARTANGKGVTIPSQIRFIRYFHQLLEQHDEETGARRRAGSIGLAGAGADSDDNRAAQKLLTDEVMHRMSGFYTDGIPDESDGEDEDESGDAVPYTPKGGGSASGGNGSTPTAPRTMIGRSAPSDRHLGAATAAGTLAIANSPAPAGEMPSFVSPLDPDLKIKLAAAGAATRQAAAVPWPEISLAGEPFGFVPRRPVAITKIVLSSVPSVSRGGNFAPFFEISTPTVLGPTPASSSERPMYKYRSTEFLRVGSYKRGPAPLELPVPNVPAVDEVRIVFSHLGATSRTKAFMLWFHTSFLPPTDASKRGGGKGGSTGGRLRLGKAELDKACKDVMGKVFAEDFAVEIFFDELGSERPLPDNTALPNSPSKKARNSRAGKSSPKSPTRQAEGPAGNAQKSQRFV